MNHSFISISLQRAAQATVIATLVISAAHKPLLGAPYSFSDFSDKSKTVENIADTLENITSQYPQTSIALDGKEVYEFTEEEMLGVVKNMISKYSSQIPSDVMSQLTSGHTSLIKCLRNYRVSGISFGIDPNFAFIVDQQNPVIEVCYKNQFGDIKHRIYQAYINSFGFKFECAIKLNLMFFTDANFNFYESNKDITIGSGFDLTSGLQNIFGFGMDVTYANFLNAPGGIVILGIPITIPLIFPIPVPGISVVTGGLLRPIG